MRISLCLLVWNELEGCRIAVPQLPRHHFEEIYAVDGGSTDGTVEYLESQRVPVYLQPKKGLNAAYIHAVEKSNCDAVVVFFPKGNVAPEYLLKFRPLLESGYDLVIASRNVKGGRNEEDSQFVKPRKWGVWGLACFAAFLWKQEGYFIRDVLHGFKGFTVDAFSKMSPTEYGLSIDLEMVIRAYRLRLKRVEFPVIETQRAFGKSHFKILPTGLKLLKCLWSELNRRENRLPQGQFTEKRAHIADKAF